MGFEPSVSRMREVWGNDPPARSLEDFLSVSIEADGCRVKSPTHVLGGEADVVPYHDLDGGERVLDADGVGYQRGDSFVAKIFRPGEIGIMMRHHRCGEGRRLSLPVGRPALREHLKLHDSHVGFVVGVEDREGAPGVVALHNPQAYPKNKGRDDPIDAATWDSIKPHVGRFGDDPAHPMVLLKLIFPNYVDPPVARALGNNVRTMAVGFNAVADYPLKDYDGNDLLGACDADTVREHAMQMVNAIAGDNATRRAALKWFGEDGHLLYCSEYVHLAVSAGLICPLNAKTFVPMVGEATWRTFSGMVRGHNRGGTTPFVQLNKNPLVRHVRLELAGESLRPQPEYAPAHAQAGEIEKLAFGVMTVSEMVETALGELLPEGEPDRGGSEARRLAEVLHREVRGLVGDRKGGRLGREDLVVPPSLFHLVAKGTWPRGLVGLSSVGHGLHFSLVRRSVR